MVSARCAMRDGHRFALPILQQVGDRAPVTGTTIKAQPLLG
jgi:hypothetical protein